jgi:hypothetical protein
VRHTPENVDRRFIVDGNYQTIEGQLPLSQPASALALSYYQQYSSHVPFAPGHYFTSWQKQPSTYEWDIPTKISEPKSIIDILIVNVLQNQRHMVAMNQLSTTERFVPVGPNFHLLLSKENCLEGIGSMYPHIQSLITNKVDEKRVHPIDMVLCEVISQYDVPGLEFLLLPEKIASFMTMYHFLMVSFLPSGPIRTYNNCHKVANLSRLFFLSIPC